MFSQLKLAPFLEKELDRMKLITPTQIQQIAIPEIMKGTSIIGKSKTGSGKTLAYLLPLVTKLDQGNKGLQGLILAPTHELAMQIYRVLEELVVETDIYIDVFIGSANIKRQLEKLKKQKPQVAVGTPGRVLELVQQKKLKIHQTTMVVVDEADRMLKEKETRQAVVEITKRVDNETQYMFFSATISDVYISDIETLIRKEITYISSDEKMETEKVKHYYVTVDDRDRIDAARRLIYSKKIKRGIVFVNHLDKVIETTDKLKYRGYKAAALSSDSDKHERAKVLKQFQSGEVEIIVASDLVARGLDVDDVTHIINVHPPVDHDAYVHRAGRTGRMGKTGEVITIVTHKEKFIIEKFEKQLGIKIADV